MLAACVAGGEIYTSAVSTNINGNLYVNGNLNLKNYSIIDSTGSTGYSPPGITGYLLAGSTGGLNWVQKTFIIEHPQDTEKYLIHACLEGPEVGVY